MARRLGFAMALVLALLPGRAEGAQWGSWYGDPWGFCPEQSFLPSTYAVVVTNDPSVPTNPERDTFWGIHPDPGYDDWYGHWYGDFAGKSQDDSGWNAITTVPYGSQGHWNFRDYGWQVHGHAKQYIAYYNWTFGGGCGYGWFGSPSPAPYMADVYGNPVVDIYVDSVPPWPPQPYASDVEVGSVTFAWPPVADRGDGLNADYWSSGMDHYSSWLTVNSGPAQQRADTSNPRLLIAAGLVAGEQACVHVIAVDALGNGTAEQRACASPLAPPPLPPAPPAATIGANPWPSGLAGLDSWFWLQPTPATVSSGESANGFQYQVAQVPSAVTWDFGDGASSTFWGAGGFGQAYPAQSSVAHAYQAQSRSGYTVSATVTYTLTWSVYTGGRWVGPYPMGSRAVVTVPLKYPVRQAQSELIPSAFPTS